MRTVVVVAMAAAMCMAAGGAQAQGRGPLFISPMGEPFRIENGVAPIQVWFATADADQDGKVSGEEFVSQAQAFFAAKLDVNHDGDATSAESTALYREQATEIFTPMAPLPVTRGLTRRFVRAQETSTQDVRRAREADRRTGAAAYGLLDAVEPVMSCDADLSRRVTTAEFQECARRRFALLDADHDGFFALAESPRAEAFVENPG